MGVVFRSLLSTGTGKTSAGVYHFSLPAGRSCPGKSRKCYDACYARKNRFQYPQVQERLVWAFEQSKRADFVGRMCDEIYRRGVLAMRWHISGDVYSPAYARKIMEVVGRSHFCRFWLYSRSWRVPTIEPILRVMALLPNLVVYYSADAETGPPLLVPDQVRVAWMQTEDDEPPDGGFDLLFRTQPLRTQRVPLHLAKVVCPQETPEGKARGVTCATCSVCLTK
jgi:hypothetical protein